MALLTNTPSLDKFGSFTLTIEGRDQASPSNYWRPKLWAVCQEQTLLVVAPTNRPLGRGFLRSFATTGLIAASHQFPAFPHAPIFRSFTCAAHFGSTNLGTHQFEGLPTAKCEKRSGRRLRRFLYFASSLLYFKLDG